MIEIPGRDQDILRRLAEEQAKIARLPVHREKAELWKRLNDLEPVRPMVWIDEIPFNELNGSGELTLQCEHPWARAQERGLRELLYQWRHFPVDMIVNERLSCPKAWRSTGFGVEPVEETIASDATNDVVSHRYRPQFIEEKDIDRIQNPEITYDEEATQSNFERMCSVYEGILPVKIEGIKFIWFSPWDRLVELWGIERLLTDLIDRPEMVNAAVERFVDAHISMLDQWEALGLLERNDDNTRIGSGGYGYTNQLPSNRNETAHLTPRNMWGCATAQIFSEVSPRMHWEFALRHEMRWLERWGLTYYGCCEPLDRKIDILRRVPNLRKISASPWNNVERFLEKAGTDYVISRKPNPALLAGDTWQPELARQDLVSFLHQARGVNVELILKDISTVRYQPQRLWEWAQMAAEVAEQFAP